MKKNSSKDSKKEDNINRNIYYVWNNTWTCFHSKPTLNDLLRNAIEAVQREGYIGIAPDDIESYLKHQKKEYPELLDDVDRDKYLEGYWNKNNGEELKQGL